MGGKVWSEEEERVFWTEVVPRSVGAAKAVAPALGWPECAGLMQEKMGKDARRTYTPSMLYEHHYQCIHLSAKSPKARNFVDKWKQDRENANGASSRPPASAESSKEKEKEDYLSLILAHDPGAKRYLRNKGVSRGRHGMANDKGGPPLASGGGGNESVPSKNQLVNVPQRAPLAHSYNLDQPVSMLSSSATHAPAQYGYGKVRQDANIDPALTNGGVAIDQSVSSSDDIPELSTSVSSDSSLEDSIPEIHMTRRYRPIAPAPIPATDTLQQNMYASSMHSTSSLATAGSQPQHIGYSNEQRAGKRQYSFGYEDDSRLKRRTLEADSQHHRALDSRPALTHWQRMGFRDEGGRARAEIRDNYNRLPPISFEHDARNRDWSSQQSTQDSRDELPRQHPSGHGIRHHDECHGEVDDEENGVNGRD